MSRLQVVSCVCFCVCSFMRAHTCHLLGLDMELFTDPACAVYEQHSMLNPASAKCWVMWMADAILPNKTLITSLISIQKAKQRINPNLLLWNHKWWSMNIQLVTRTKHVIAPIGQNMKWNSKVLLFSLSQGVFYTSLAPFQQQNNLLCCLINTRSPSFYRLWLRYFCNSASPNCCSPCELTQTHTTGEFLLQPEALSSLVLFECYSELREQISWWSLWWVRCHLSAKSIDVQYFLYSFG